MLNDNYYCVIERAANVLNEAAGRSGLLKALASVLVLNAESELLLDQLTKALTPENVLANVDEHTDPYGAFSKQIIGE